MSEARAITAENAAHKRIVVGSRAYLYLLLPLVPCFLVPSGMRVKVLLLYNLAVLLLLLAGLATYGYSHREPLLEVSGVQRAGQATVLHDLQGDALPGLAPC